MGDSQVKEREDIVGRIIQAPDAHPAKRARARSAECAFEENIIVVTRADGVPYTVSRSRQMVPWSRPEERRHVSPI